jgi:4-amino-4-deoxy-L-arabinose transferase-like glycosyltransferase
MGVVMLSAHLTLVQVRLLSLRRLLVGIEVAAMAAVLALAFALRLHGLMDLPRLGDETREVQLGLRVAHGELFPLVGVDPYVGALFTYLVAGAFSAIGPTLDAGRLVVMTAGLFTIVLTYLLGRDLASHGGVTDARDRLVGLLAALLLAVSGPHIMTSSRIAYSNSLTPLFTTAALWLLHHALIGRSGAALVASGLAFGLALQTHVTALALGPGLVALLLVHRGGWLRQDGSRPRWLLLKPLVLAAGAATLAVTNLIVFNAGHGLLSFTVSGHKIDRYAGADLWTLSGWGDRLMGLSRAVALAISGQVSETAGSAAILLSPFVVASVCLALLGLWVFARRGVYLPLLVTISVLLVVSALNGRVEPIVPRVRHYASLLPLGAIAIAEALVWLRDVLARGRNRDWMTHAALAATALCMVLGAVVPLRAYEAERLSRPDKNNLEYLAVLNGVAATGTTEDRVYIDDQLAEVLTLSGGRMLDHLRFGLSVAGQEYDTIDVEHQSLPIGRTGTISRRLLLAPQTVDEASARYRLEPLLGDAGDGAQVRSFRAFPLNAT